MSMYAKIITDDKRFERMLSLELADRGFEILGDIGADAKFISKKNFYALVDLDFCQENDLSDLSSYANVIGFSNNYQDAESESVRCCCAVLHRPFLMDELFSAIFSDVKPHNQKRIRQIRSGDSHVRDKKGHLRVDHASKKAIWGNDGIALSDTEYKVLSLLCEKRGEVVTRQEIDELLEANEGNSADVYICMLRRKIDNRLGVKLIYTVRGEGYKLKN